MSGRTARTVRTVRRWWLAAALVLAGGGVAFAEPPSGAVAPAAERGTEKAVPHGSRFMRFPGAPGSKATTEPDGSTSEPVASAGPASGSIEAAMVRIRMWAAGRGPTGPIATVASAQDWCDAAICPLLDSIENLLEGGDGAGALAAIGKLRARIDAEVTDPCDRHAGQAAANQLECEASARAPAGRVPLYCVTRTDDPAGPFAKLEGCTDRLCDDDSRLAKAAGTLRWAVCKANTAADDGPAPRIQFALEPRSCDEGAPRFAPIVLAGAGVTVLRAHTTIDGYTQPGATAGNLAERRAPASLPTVTGTGLVTSREEVTPLLEISATDVVVAGLEIDEAPGEAGILIDRRGESEARCPAGGRNAWIKGNLFGGDGRTAIFVAGAAAAFGRSPAVADLDGIVIGTRADHPDPAALNVFRGREGAAVMVVRGRTQWSRRRVPRVRNTEVRGNWFAQGHDQPSLGLFLDGTDDDVVECNRFGEVHSGVAVVRGRGASVRRNLFVGTGSAIKLTDGAEHVTVGGFVPGKKDKKDRTDPLAALCPGPEVGNRIEAPDEAVELDGRVSDVVVAGNSVVGGFAAGITVHASSTGDVAARVRIDGNEIVDSEAGIRVSGGDVTVLGNRIVGSRGYAIQVNGTELARLTPPLAPRVRVGTVARPNVLERNGAGGILLVDAEAVNQQELGRENRFVANRGPLYLGCWRGLLRVLDAQEPAQPLAGAQVTIDADDWLGEPFEATTDAAGFAAPTAVDPADPLTWPLIPSWAVVDEPDRAEVPAPETPPGAPPAPPPAPLGPRHLMWSPQRVRIESGDRRWSLRLPWDGHTAVPPKDGVAVEEVCVGGADPGCEGGLALLRKIVVTPSRVPGARTGAEPAPAASAQPPNEPARPPATDAASPPGAPGPHPNAPE